MAKEQDYLPAFTVRVKPRGEPHQAYSDPIVILVDTDGNEAGRLTGIAGAKLIQGHDWPELEIRFAFFEHEAVNHMPGEMASPRVGDYMEDAA